MMPDFDNDGCYTLDNGKDIPVYNVHHPSRGVSYKKEYEGLIDFIDNI